MRKGGGVISIDHSPIQMPAKPVCVLSVTHCQEMRDQTRQPSKQKTWPICDFVTHFGEHIDQKWRLHNWQRLGFNCKLLLLISSGGGDKGANRMPEQSQSPNTSSPT